MKSSILDLSFTDHGNNYFKLKKLRAGNGYLSSNGSFTKYMSENDSGLFGVPSAFLAGKWKTL